MIATIRTLAVSAAATLAAVAGIPAHAADLGDQRSVEIRHGDLDLTSAQGSAALQRRVRLAVRSVCGTADTRDLAAQQRMAACRAQANAAARPRVDLAIASARSATQLAQNVGAPSLHAAAH
ncbi:UrcA family protein [Sphingomonas profundi]|uniref:UrcA family protein n=1 Tax=Alterirhizorhabdus profundi TaxID=2681549 RepID=UPI0012E825C8|nr:UrcA family protein [Sphingomonas profundi]